MEMKLLQIHDWKQFLLVLYSYIPLVPWFKNI